MPLDPETPLAVYNTYQGHRELSQNSVAKEGLYNYIDIEGDDFSPNRYQILR